MLLSLDSMLNYGAVLLPIVVPQLLFQPLDGSVFVPGALPVTAELGRSLIFNRNRQDKSPWTVLTYMLVHGSTAHLISNLQGLAINGHAVHSAVGEAGLYMTFIGGGICAALDPLNLKELQLVREYSHRLLCHTDTSGYLGTLGLAELWNRGAEKMVKTFAPYLVAKSDFVGSSGGVAALAGANCVLGIEQLATLWRHYRRTGHTPSLDTLVSTVAPLLPLLSYVQGEYMRLSMGTSSGIDHAGHLTGLLFGATTLACVRLVGSTGSGGGSRALGSRGS